MVLLQEQSVCHFAQPTSAVLEYNAHVRAKRANTDGPTGCSTRQGTVGCNNPQHHNVLTAEIASLHGMPAKILKETELPVSELIIEQPHLHIKQTSIFPNQTPKIITAKMQFIAITTLAISAIASAAAVSNQVPGHVQISLPPGCTKEDLASKNTSSSKP